MDDNTNPYCIGCGRIKIECGPQEHCSVSDPELYEEAREAQSLLWTKQDLATIALQSIEKENNMRQNDNTPTDQQVIEHYIRAMLWVAVITIILILLFNAENIADIIFSGEPLLPNCEVPGSC